MTHTPRHPIPQSLHETSALIQLIQATDRRRTPQPTARPSHKLHPKPKHPHRTPSNLTASPRLFRPHLGLTVSPEPHTISPTLRAQLNLAFQNGWGRKTLTNYGYTVDRFLAFCDAEKVPQNLRLPTHEFILSAFAASHTGIHAGSTARNDIAALKAWHVAQQQPWLGGPRLHYVLSGVESLSPQTASRPPRPPITPDMLLSLRRGLDFASHFDVAVFAAACVAFWGQCRLGELLPDSRSDKTLNEKPSRANISFHRDTLTIRLPRTKTQKHGEDVVLVSQRSEIDPILALRMHFVANPILPPAHLFAYQCGSSYQPLTRRAFLNRCNDIWGKEGYPKLSGHSFRIGGTTELLLSGVPIDLVKKAGRWSSDAFLKYWRSLQDLVPRYIRNVHKRKR
ncbi:DNA breaking-rejoining enzyme [Mycena indigotica]|uniref:DNA breaking-rejoining enzyme n=1 Tax=Mycena indigotica TaxID=2126181 RepID=A0A8H6W5A7_9AGAR|nr:DNA breaking-rejoining enzyme [Mycena indigotica]KAF7303391.1 DNA breaking-rejoining enzyme [Mycena indigotica]